MVTKATLRTDVWNTIYTHFQAGTYQLSTDNIFSAYNSTLAKDKGYPLVIINPPTISYVKENVRGDVTNSEITFMIEVYHNSSENMKSMVDEVTNSLMTGRAIFQEQRMMNMNIDAGDYNTWEEEGGKKKHMSEFPVSFRYIN